MELPILLAKIKLIVKLTKFSKLKDNKVHIFKSYVSVRKIDESEFSRILST